MFGYLRPAQGELKVYELERYKECYCGLCHALGNKYGPVARFFLNYELVFLSMLLWEPDEKLTICRKRCIASPHKKKRFCAINSALEKCAGYSVILSWWKLSDTLNDESFFSSLKHRILLLLLKRAYKKASRDYGDFNAGVASELKYLAEYESQDERSIDGAADKFARALCSAVPLSSPEAIRRPMRELLYHLGRWIYIIDACDDYSADVKSGNYNPVALLLPTNGNENNELLYTLPTEERERLRITLTHSNNLVCSAFELLPESIWTGTLRNTIYIGMNEVMCRVLNGQWNNKKRRFRE